MDKIEFILDNIPSPYYKEKDGNVYHILNSMAVQLDAFIKNMDEVKNSRFIDTAKGYNLDRIAILFNMKRFVNENDESFRGRIKAKVPSFIGGGTIESIKQVVQNYLGVEPVIIEHYKQGEGHALFTNGVLNGLLVESIDSSNIKINSGIVYTEGLRYNLNESSHPINAGDNYVKYSLIPDNTSSIINFNEKISGSNVENPHFYGRRTNTTYGNPTVPDTYYEPPNTDYNEIKSLDNILDITTYTQINVVSMHMFSFNLIEHIKRKYGFTPTVQWLKDNIKNLTYNWYGYGSNILSNTTGKADFKDKIVNSTVENPHISRHGYGTSLLLPSGSWAAEGQSNYNAIKILDGTTFKPSTSSSGQIAQQIFSFNLIEYVQRKYNFTVPGINAANQAIWLKENINKLTIKWHGKGSGPSGNKASINLWSVYNNNWLFTRSHTLGTISDLALSAATTDPTGYRPMDMIDSNGFIHYITHAEASDSIIASTIETDFIELEVEIVAGSNKASINAWRTNAWMTLANHTASTTSKATAVFGNTVFSTYKIPEYIDNNGFIHFLVNADKSNGLAPSTINTDYVELNVQLKEAKFVFMDTNDDVKNNQILLAKVNGTTIEDKRLMLNPEQHYITNTASITVQIPYTFDESKISLEDTKNILRNTKAAGVALLIKTIETYKEIMTISDTANSHFIVGFSGIGSNNCLGGK